MTTLDEIETAVEALPRHQKQQLLLFVAERLQQDNESSIDSQITSEAKPTGEVAAAAHKAVPPQPLHYPDFVARAKAIWGENPPGPSLSELVSQGREADL